MRAINKKLLPFMLGSLLLSPLESAFGASVMVDAGHGGSDPGAVGVNGLQEKYVNLDISIRLRDELERRGYTVYMTRTDDRALKLQERVEMTNALMPDLFVSIHANSYTNPGTRGSLMLYYDKDYPQASYPASEAMTALTPESKRLAQLVQDSLVREAGTVDKGLVPSSAYVVRMGSVPSVLVETAFLSNREDAALLADAEARARMAKGVADGITAYLPPTNKTSPGSPTVFKDVNYGHWAAGAIVKLQSKGIVQGEYGRFYPERALTRAEFVAMLDRQFPLPAIAGKTKELCAPAPGASKPASTVTASTYGSAPAPTCVQPPKDIPDNHWARSHLLKAYEQGVLEGYSGGTVQPERTLTRGEAAALIDRVVWPGLSQKAASVVFADVPKSLWSAASINRLKAKGILEGVSSTSFAPERPITRAEMAAILDRLIQ